MRKIGNCGLWRWITLLTLIYKYEYWGTADKLVKVKTKGGGILHKFFISKLDIALDSGVSISMLEKKDQKNPLILLEKLGLIKIIKRTMLTKSKNSLKKSPIFELSK